MEAPTFASGAVRALTLLHERELRAFLGTWRRARAADLALPATDDANYASLEHLLFHVLRAARGYLTWCCSVLELDDPGVRPTPEPAAVAGEAEAYLEHLLERWRSSPLAAVPDARLHEGHRSRWGVEYCIDAMLEHAVMHPVRHAFQLEQLLA